MKSTSQEFSSRFPFSTLIQFSSHKLLSRNMCDIYIRKKLFRERNVFFIFLLLSSSYFACIRSEVFFFFIVSFLLLSTTRGNDKLKIWNWSTFKMFLHLSMCASDLWEFFFLCYFLFSKRGLNEMNMCRSRSCVNVNK